MVQPCTVISPAELRAQLGMTRTQFARAVRASIRSVINWEMGHAQPSQAHAGHIRNLARWHRIKTRHQAPVPIRSWDEAKAKYYAGKPGVRWKQMTGQQRAAFYSRRAFYARMLADIQSGRAHADTHTL